MAFHLDMSVRRVNFRGAILETGTLLSKPWQKSREDEGPNQNKSNENGGEGMWSRSIQEVKFTKHRGD